MRASTTEGVSASGSATDKSEASGRNARCAVSTNIRHEFVRVLSDKLSKIGGVQRK